MTQPLSAAHRAARERPRRIVVNFDVISGDQSFGGRDPQELIAWKFDFIDRPDSQVDSVWWEWGEGHQAPWPSQTMPLYDAEGYRRWAADDVDIVAEFVAASHKRGIEAFYGYRINGSDNDLGPVREMPMKTAHPEWLIHTWNTNGYWNFAFEGVREYKLSILREICGRYDIDGIALDFARVCPVLPPGEQWLHRHELTAFLRGVREVTETAAVERGRPLLVAARVPENLPGCHFDGLDVEAWCREELVDLLALGVRSFDVEVEAFRRIAGPSIRLYPSIDDHHASDGYQTPPLAVYRGAAANWWSQGADGVQTFNFNHAPDSPYKGEEISATHLQACAEIGSPETLRCKDKVFVVQRRGGGHGPTVVPNPEDWSTPRWMYCNTNMLAPLPVALSCGGRSDTILTVKVADPVADEAETVAVEVRMLISDPAAARLAAAARLPAVTIARIGHSPPLLNESPLASLAAALEVRVNGVRLPAPTVEDGWLVCAAPPEAFAAGDNLVALLPTGRDPQTAPLRLEKLEVHVRYP